ncbi:OLC1v1036875C1 [Oldenlandia corymbosa var. corymbosa]|uniref:OLC1v1036875C1 n=1 Tax=Oldenlandia corymbosa var. corymbosa TaxID=529605 RepID=A0AAV1CWA6_OLDCO|nr:OLC1v1036875C1 [Oldenlandia corymbosa var. corymbosa]
MAGKGKPKKKQGVAGSRGLQGSSSRNLAVHGDDKGLKEKVNPNEVKEVKKDEAEAAEALVGLKDSSGKKAPAVLGGKNGPESHTDDQESGTPADGEVKFEPVYVFDESRNLVQVDVREISSQPPAEFQHMAPRRTDDDPYVYSDGIEFRAPEQREIFRKFLGKHLIIPDAYNPDEAPAPKSPDLNQRGASNSDDPPHENSNKGKEQKTVSSTKENKNGKSVEKRIKCGICEGDIAAEQLRRVAKCGHCFCYDCLKDNVTNNYEQQIKVPVINVGCPGYGCKDYLNDDEMFDCLPSQLRIPWLELKNPVRMTQLQRRFTALKNIAGEFMTMLNEIP